MNSGFERNDEKNDVYNKLPLKKNQGSFVKVPEFQKINDLTTSICNLDLAQITSGQGHDTSFMCQL